jgi:hypothetical protein
MISILFAAALPVACSFSKASQNEIFPDGSAPIDLGLPSSGGDGGGGTLTSDAMVTCVEANPQTMNLPPDVLIVLDRSGSMNDDLNDQPCMAGCTSKWTTAVQTLTSYLPTVETTVNWGLKLFASGSQSCSVNAGAEVPPAASNATAIINRLNRTTAGSATPTTAALMAAAAYLKGLNDGNPKFILLATDGIPTCGTSMCAAGVNTGGGSPNQCDDANAIAAVKAVHDTDGISTFVLGIGTANSPGDGTLSAMATAGGFPRNDTPAYFPIGSADDLTQAFMSITQTVGQCFFSVTPALTSGQSIGAVTYQGGTIPQDATNGYSIVGKSGIQLNGQSCDDFMAGKIKNVHVQVDCNG